jgi:hypothetical protein
MLRASTDPAAAYYGAFVTPGNGIVVQARTTGGAYSYQVVAVAGTVPAYVKVSRSGTTFTAYTSADGVTWTAIAGSTVTLSNLGGALLGGIAATSHNGGTLCAVTFDHVSIG